MTTDARLVQLARHSLIYGIGTVFTAAGGFLLIPLYTYVLSTGEYGILELLNRIADVLMLVLFMGVRQGYIRFYFDHDTEDWKKQVTGTMLVFTLMTGILISAVLYMSSGLIVSGVFKGEIADVLILLLMAWIPFEMLTNVGLSFLQIRMQSTLFVAVGAIRLAAFIALNYMFLYHFDYGVKGVFLANLIITGILAIIALVYFIWWTRMQISGTVMKGLITFGLPYVPSAFFMYLISNTDRYLIGVTVSLEALGIYALAAKLGMLISSLLLTPFLRVWAPFLFESHDKPEGPALVGKVYTLVTMVSVGFALLISVLSPVIIPLISDDAYYEAFRYVPLICLAAVFYTMQHLSDAGILIEKKTYLKPVIFGAGAVVAVIGNLILIPRFGLYGAAITSVVAFFVLLVMTHRLSKPYFEIPLDMRKIVIIFLAAGISYGVSAIALYGSNGSLLAHLMSVSSVLLFPLILAMAGFFNREQLAIVRKVLSRNRPEGSVEAAVSDE